MCEGGRVRVYVCEGVCMCEGVFVRGCVYV